MPRYLLIYYEISFDLIKDVHNGNGICDEIFGEQNFISQLVWERAYAPVNLKKHFSLLVLSLRIMVEEDAVLLCCNFTASHNSNHISK